MRGSDAAIRLGGRGQTMEDQEAKTVTTTTSVYEMVDGVLKRNL
jgi:hypothetical protein